MKMTFHRWMIAIRLVLAGADFGLLRAGGTWSDAWFIFVPYLLFVLPWTLADLFRLGTPRDPDRVLNGDHR